MAKGSSFRKVYSQNAMLKRREEYFFFNETIHISYLESLVLGSHQRVIMRFYGSGTYMFSFFVFLFFVRCQPEHKFAFDSTLRFFTLLPHGSSLSCGLPPSQLKSSSMAFYFLHLPSLGSCQDLQFAHPKRFVLKTNKNRPQI